MKNWEAMEEILSDMGINNLSIDQIKEVTQSFEYHLDMMREMDSYQYIDRNPKCPKCEGLKEQLKDAERRNEIFEKSVKQRRNCERVWIQDETVMYE